MIRKLTICVLVILFSLSAARAQGNWGGGVDDENIHFGFAFRYVASEFKIQKLPNWRDPLSESGTTTPQETLKSISSPVNPGFALGLVSDLRINKHLNLRFTPSLVFSDRMVDYEFESGTTYQQEGVESPENYTRRSVIATMTEFPLSLKLKSDRLGNFRTYILGGIKYGIDISSKKKSFDADKVYFQKFLKNQKGFLSYEAGIGFDIYFEFFKMSPELKFSQSFNSILKRDLEPYSTPIDKLFLRNFIFSLYFE